MKKKLFALCLLLFITAFVSGIGFAAITPSILVNGRFVYADVPPQIINGRVMVPLRAVAEALGIEVKWDDGMKAVVIDSPIVGATSVIEPVARYWHNTRQTIPPIEGPEHFKEQVEKAFDILKEKTPEIYRAATNYINKIEYGDLSDNHIASILLPSATVRFDKDFYEEYLKDNDIKALYVIAATIAHETTHAQVYFSGLSNGLGSEYEEVVSTVTSHRVASLLDDELEKIYEEEIVERLNNL